MCKVYYPSRCVWRGEKWLICPCCCQDSPPPPSQRQTSCLIRASIYVRFSLFFSSCVQNGFLSVLSGFEPHSILLGFTLVRISLKSVIPRWKRKITFLKRPRPLRLYALVDSLIIHCKLVWSSGYSRYYWCCHQVAAFYLKGDPNPAFYLKADPDQAFHFNTDPHPALYQSNANPRPLIHRSFRPPIRASRLHCGRPRPSPALFWASKAPDFKADPDPASKNNADPDPQSWCSYRFFFFMNFTCL
jgi:hypothetical protein